MTSSGERDAVPVPCRTCGAPMEEAGAELHGDVEMKCTYCGATETLPAEPSERVRVLRRRLQQISWARQNAEAPALSMATAIEQWKGSAVLVAGFVALIIAVQVASQLSAAPAGRSASELATTLLPAVIQFGVLASVMASGFLGMTAYARAVRPGLLAFAPSEPGAPPRCRCCGGDLPRQAVAGAFVTCAYCNAPNLLSSKLSERRKEDLDRELDAHRKRAAGMDDAMATGREKMMRASYIGLGLGLALSFAGYLMLSWIATT